MLHIFPKIEHDSTGKAHEQSNLTDCLAWLCLFSLSMLHEAYEG